MKIGKKLKKVKYMSLSDKSFTIFFEILNILIEIIIKSLNNFKLYKNIDIL